MYLALQINVIGNRHTSNISERISGANLEKARGKSDSPKGNDTVPCQSSFRVSAHNRVNLLTYFTKKCGMSEDLSRESQLSEDLPVVASRREDPALLPNPACFVG